MVQHPLRSDAGDLLELHDHQPPAGPQGLADRSQTLLGPLEVVIRVADEHQIDRIGGQTRGIVRADDARHVRQVLFPAGALDVLDELLRDIDRVHLARRDQRREQPREQARPGPDVGHVQSGLQPASRHDLLPLLENLAAFALEVLDRLADVGIIAEAGVDIFAFRRFGSRQAEPDQHQGS
ncbi:MAG: hypothetical protein MUE50_12110 [Pirellulaceae bacterium]|nr:hypothetical protein [Pirellulaceae bacterium]